MSEGKAILDHAEDGPDPQRARKFADIERRNSQTVGAKEMAMTRRPRAEDGAARAERFLKHDRAAGD